MGELIPTSMRVAILGANGQVGAELCLYLKVMGFCEPVAVTRSSNSNFFLSRAGIDCRSGDLASPQVAAKLLNDCDLIFDLALPNGRNLSETKRMLRARSTSIFSVARPSKGFVLASTTSVYRYSAELPFFRTYRSMKLFAERLSQSLGARHQVPVYVFRLGQVHGALQSCSDSLRRGILTNTGAIHVPGQPSNAIFVVEIAEAIRAVLFEQVTPDTYTVISQPARSFIELIESYADELGVSPPIIVEDVKTATPIQQGLSAVCGWVKQGLSGLVGHYKELLSAIVSAFSEELDQKLRFARTRSIAASAMSAYLDSLPYRPFDALNEIPGTRFPIASDSRMAVGKYQRDVEDLIRRLT
ncbi:MAG: NAD(P)-dependent oxidoreductase [Proteobacteria bacterium]|nr:NAD(P)-dependent oxidoreductase [Pseudomonadota bacterium]